jgi:hypothetical protein
MKRIWLATAALLAWQASAAAQTTAGIPPAPPIASDAAPAASPPVVPPGVKLTTGALVAITLDEPVGSNSRKRGDKFAIELAEPIVVDGKTVAPAGAKGVGEVVYADHSGGGGTPGKLVLAARYIDVGDTRIRLKAFNLAAGGDSDYRSLAFATAVIGVGVFLINGGEVLYTRGTRASAKIAEDVVFPVQTATSAATAPPSPTPASAVSPPAGALSSPLQQEVTP